jgi:hypothetical protein
MDKNFQEAFNLAKGSIPAEESQQI